MSDWKLPEHLEPYREYINIHSLSSVESAFDNPTDFLWADEEAIKEQINLLQRLYDAGRLK